MNTREFLKTCLGGSLLTTALPSFITPKCPNCGAALAGSTCLYCKSPVVGVYPDDIVVFNTPEMEAPADFDPYHSARILSKEVSKTLTKLQARFTSVSARWMGSKDGWVGNKLGYFRVEIVRSSPYFLSYS